MDILTSLQRSTSMHISDLIHEWMQQRKLILDAILDQLLAKWFMKSLLPTISHDITMGGVVSKEKTIGCVQYLDLVYSQYGTLYDLILNAPRMSTNPSKPSSDAHSNGFIFSLKNYFATQSIGPISHSTSTPTTMQNSTPPNSTSSPTKTS